MAKVKIAQTLFTQGELGSYLDGRADNEVYGAGVKTLTNMLILPHGGVMRRPGFEYIAVIPDNPRLARFNFNNEQEYVLVFTEELVEIFRDKVSQVTVATPYAAADLPSLRFTQSGDTLIIVHEDYAPRELRRDGAHDAWSMATISFDTYPYHRFATDVSVTPSGTTGSINLTAASAYWESGHVGTRVYINGGIVTINTITSSLIAACTVVETLDSTTASTAWKEEAWSAVRGYPRTVTFYQNRLYFGGTRDAPSTIFASKTADAYNFDDGVTVVDITDDMAFSFTLSTDQIHFINDIKALRNLHLFTSDGEFAMSGGAEGITPFNVQIEPQSSYGSADIPVMQVEDEILYCTRNNKEVRSFLYSFESDKYVSKNYTTIAHHMLDEVNSPVGMAYLRSYKDTQGNFIFLPRADGSMPVLSVDVRKGVLGWSVIETEGSFLDAVSVSTNHGSGFRVDTLYVAVTRSNADDSTSQTFLECLTEDEAYMDHWYVGNSATAKTAWAGATTLHDAEVQVIADGLVHENITVEADGDFTLNSEATQVVIGLAYTSTLLTMKLDRAINGEFIRGERQRKVKALVNLVETKSLNVDGFAVPFRFLGDELLDQPLTSFTGIKEVRLGGYGLEHDISITVTDPLPATVLSLQVELFVG